MEKREETALLVELSRQVRAALVELELFGLDALDDDFSGTCAIAAWLLVERARRFDIKLHLVLSHSHGWCELEDGTVVDPTYSQFNEEIDVWLGRRTPEHKASASINSDWPGLSYDERAYEFLGLWPEEQNPLSIHNRLILDRWLDNVAEKAA